MKKIIIISIVIVAMLGAIFLYSARDLISYKYFTNKYLGEVEILQDAYKNDSYGATTPEETLELFVSALKAGDAKLASNYFVPEKREKMREDISFGLKEHGVDLLVTILEKDKRKVELESNVVRFEVVDDEGYIESSFDLILNEYTGKWLIRDL